MLDSRQLGFLEENGFLVVENVLDHDRTIAPLRREYEELARSIGEGWVAESKLDPVALGGSFEDWIIASYRAGLDYFQPMDISLPPGEITPEIPFHAGPAIFGLMTDSRLLDIVESVIGPEITSNPIQHVRIKPPADDLRRNEIRSHITATHWHQDRAVTLPEADRTRMVTAWVAITDATAANGCLQVIPGSHRGRMLLHCPQPQLAIPPELMDESLAHHLPVRAGGVILFHPLTIHGSLANTTQGVRWSFDLRYHATGDPSGRPMFPGFVARSRAAPEAELRDPNEWRSLWEAARAELSAGPPVALHRWAGDSAQCA